MEERQIESRGEQCQTPTFSCRASLISMMPVALMQSGRSKGGFSMPRLPCRYLRLKHQCRGTGTVFLVACTKHTQCETSTVLYVTACWWNSTVPPAHVMCSNKTVWLYNCLLRPHTATHVQQQDSVIVKLSITIKQSYTYVATRQCGCETVYYDQTKLHICSNKTVWL